MRDRDPDKRSPAQVLADRRASSMVSVRQASGAFSAPTRQVDAKTRELIDRALEKRGGRR